MLYRPEMDNIFNDHHLNILDLPDEILLIILKNVNAIDIISSLLGINRRLDRLIVDPLHIRHVDMTNGMIENSLYDLVSSTDVEILSKLCQNLLHAFIIMTNNLLSHQIRSNLFFTPSIIILNFIRYHLCFSKKTFFIDI